MLDRARRRLSLELEVLVCSLDDHGPFTLPVVSTADRSPAPSLWCATCSSDCSHLFDIEKIGGLLRIRNQRETSAILLTFDDEIEIGPGELVIYSAGKFCVSRNRDAGPDSGSQEYDDDIEGNRTAPSLSAPRINRG